MNLIVSSSKPTQCLLNINKLNDVYSLLQTNQVQFELCVFKPEEEEYKISPWEHRYCTINYGKQYCYMVAKVEGGEVKNKKDEKDIGDDTANSL